MKISIENLNYSKKINNTEDVLKAISFYIFKFSNFLKKNKLQLLLYWEIGTKFMLLQ